MLLHIPKNLLLCYGNDFSDDYVDDDDDDDDDDDVPNEND